MRFKFYFYFTCILLLCASAGYSQGIRLKESNSFTKHERLSLLASLGLSTYYGDLCDAFECMQFRPNFGIGAMYRITSHLSNKTEVNYYRLYSKDVYEQRNLNFRSGNVEAYTSLVFDIFAYTKHYRKRKLISPYLLAGFGITYYNPKGEDPTSEGTWVALRPLKTEGKDYSSITPIIPFGGGVRIKFKRNMEFMVEFAYRKTFTDFLDDVSGENYLPVESRTAENARFVVKSQDPGYVSQINGQLRGNPNKLDGYFLTNVKLRYIVGTARSHFKGKHPLLKPHHN